MIIMKQSRTTNTIYNFITSIGGQLLTIILQFIVRTVFISTLGKEYLGISGLFSNILQMLSLAELGFGSAILFKLYEPISKNDTKRINLLLKLYKKVYQFVGLFIIVIGVLLIPFLKYIVSDYDSLKPLGINATLIYVLYLLRTVVSYFFLAYKSAIVKADQKEYKLNLIIYLVTLITSIAQIVVLYVLRNFEIYVGILVIGVLLQNYLSARLAQKLYPYIDDKYDENISKDELKTIFKDCGALLIYRINTVVLKATDNIIISIYLGLGTVGMYSNYYILYSTIDTVFGKIFESVLHSLGNLHTTKNIEHEYIIFKTINLIALIIGAIAGVGIACVANEFIITWIGEDWVLAQPFSILMGIELYGLASRQYLSKYRSAMGLFQQAKYRPLFGMIINLIVSLLLVKKLGISGVLIGTIIADWTTIMWYDPYIIHKYGLQNKFSILKYYLKNIYGVFLAGLSGVLCYLICNNFLVGLGWISVIVHAVIICIIVSMIYIIFFIKSDEVNEIKNIIKRILKKILNRVSSKKVYN